MSDGHKIVLVGLNFRSATLEQMEMFQIGRKSLSKVLQDIKSIDGVNGVVVLSTCNRTEFYLSTTEEIIPEQIIFSFYENYLNK